MLSYSVKLLLVGILLACLCPLHGQTEEYPWPDDIKPTEGIDFFKSDYDAVILYENHILNFTGYASGVTLYQVNKRIKIFTELGLSQNAYVYIPVGLNQEIDLIDAITIKSDGSVIDLNANEIYSVGQDVDEDEMTDDQPVSYRKFAIPGVEVGDEIEIVYRLNINDYTGGDVIPNSELFSFNTRYIFLLPSTVDFACQLNNDFPQPEIFNWSNNGHRADFTVKNSPSIADESLSIPQLSVPWFSFVVTPYEPVYNTDHTNDWIFMHQLLKSILQNPKKASKKQIKYYQQLVSRITYGEDSKFARFKKLFNYLSDSIEFREQIADKELEKSNEYFLEKGYIDNTVRYRLLVQFLDDLQLNYQLAFARDRYRGPIKITEPRINEVDEYLLVIHDEWNEPHYLCLNHPYYHYEIDEIPAHLSGSRIAFINESSAFRLDSTMLPVWETSTNSMRETLDINIDPGRPDTSKMEAFATFTGHSAAIYRGLSFVMQKDTILRSAFDEYRKYESPNITIDSSAMHQGRHEFPFDISYHSHVRIADAFKIINDTLMSIPIEYYINHTLLETKTKNRKLDCYPEFGFTQSLAVTFHFPENMQIELLNTRDLDLETTNSVGSYSIETEIHDNTLRLISDYTVSGSVIPVEDIQNIDELNDTCYRAKHSTLLVSIKPLTGRD